MHGLIFETSICYWQDQPDILAPRALQSVGPLQEVHSALIVNTNANFPTHTPTLPTWSVLCCGREIHTLTHSSVKQFNCNPIAARQQISFLIQPTLIHIECTSAYPLSRVPWEKYSLSHGKHIQPKGIHTVLAYTTRANTYHRCCCLRSLRGPSLGLPTGRHSQLNGPTPRAVTFPADPAPIPWSSAENPKNFFSYFSTFQTKSDRLGRKKNFAPKSPTLTFFSAADQKSEKFFFAFLDVSDHIWSFGTKKKFCPEIADSHFFSGWWQQDIANNPWEREYTRARANLPVWSWDDHLPAGRHSASRLTKFSLLTLKYTGSQTSQSP